MGARRVREVMPREGGCAPRLVIDEGGREVAVLVDYSQYVVLLDVIASVLDRRALPRYWQAAMSDCVQLPE